MGTLNSEITSVNPDENVNTAANSSVTRGWRGERFVISLTRAACSFAVEISAMTKTGAKASANCPMSCTPYIREMSRVVKAPTTPIARKLTMLNAKPER